MRGKVNDQYIKDVQSGQLKCTKFRRALLSAIQYIRSLNDAQTHASTNNYNRGGVPHSTSTKVVPGLSNRIEKNDITVTSKGRINSDNSSSSQVVRKNKAEQQKNSYYKSSLLKRKLKFNTQKTNPWAPLDP